ncbi:MAG: NAD(P)H-binding protein [Candidatus Krumholzibacteria bacterium]|nr:NAD(P)H-binding protein [Candidatus Krumholzibacteria bacterium]
MKVLITGGTGYVGSTLREYIRAQGHDVRLLVRSGSEHKVDSPSSYEIIVGDVFNTNACLRACDGCAAVVHLVGIIREFPSQGVVFDQFHRVATINMVDAARRSGVERFVHMSALGARENAVSTYHRTKYKAEQYLQKSPLRWTIFRPSWIIGAGDGLTEQISELVHKIIVPLIDGGRMLVQPIALEDVCTCMSKALAMPETQSAIYELGGADRITMKEIIHSVAAHMGVKIRTMDVPTWAIRPIVAALERFPSFPLTRDQLRMMAEENVCEVDRYVKTFRVEPKPFAEVLPTVIGDRAAHGRSAVLL